MSAAPLGVLAVMDGYRLTGPARQLVASALPGRCGNARITLGVFQRAHARTPFMRAVEESRVPMVVLRDRFPGDPRTLGALAWLAARPGTRVLQTHGYKANVLAALIPRRVRRPWIAFLHGETWENWKVHAYFALERLAVRRADRIVAVSHQMARRLAARGIPAAKIRVIHNACLGSSNDDAVAAWEPGAPAVVGVVGRLSPEKGVDVALRVHRTVTRARPDARLWVFGEGQEEASLRARAGELGIADSVEWRGYETDPARLYGRLGVLLLPSRSEGLPNVALEAMAHGIPVVATAVGGVPEVVSEGRTGFLAPSEDAERLAGHVVRLLDDAALRLRLGRQGREDVAARFSLAARLAALGALYAELAA